MNISGSKTNANNKLTNLTININSQHVLEKACLQLSLPLAPCHFPPVHLSVTDL